MTFPGFFSEHHQQKLTTYYSPIATWLALINFLATLISCSFHYFTSEHHVAIRIPVFPGLHISFNSIFTLLFHQHVSLHLCRPFACLQVYSKALIKQSFSFHFFKFWNYIFYYNNTSHLRNVSDTGNGTYWKVKLL